MSYFKGIASEKAAIIEAVRKAKAELQNIIVYKVEGFFQETLYLAAEEGLEFTTNKKTIKLTPIFKITPYGEISSIP